MSYVIEFEGVDASGKTTQASLLFEALSEKGFDVELIGSSDRRLSSPILNYLNQEGAQPIETICLLSAANDLTLAGKLEEDKVFLLDRYIYTSIASYLTMGQDQKWIFNLYKKFRKSDIVFLMDISSEEACRRKGGITTPLEEGSPLVYRGSKYNGFEEYQNDIREAFLYLSRRDPNFVVLDASENIDLLHREILDKVISTLLKEGVR
jgi:dTMP kinase